MFFSVFSVFSETDLLCSSGIRTCCSGDAASRKEIYHGVNHTQEHGTEEFTPIRNVRFLPTRHFV